MSTLNQAKTLYTKHLPAYWRALAHANSIRNILDVLELRVIILLATNYYLRKRGYMEKEQVIAME